MPNWVANYITVTGKDADKLIQNYLIKDKESDKYKFDFNKIIPMPKEVEIISGSITDNCIAVYLSTLPKQEQSKQFNLIYENAIFPEFINKKRYAKSAGEITQIVKDLISYSGMNKGLNEPTFKTKKDIVDYGKQAIDNIIKYGAMDWYDWSIKNWGTKWNACDTCYNENSPNEIWFNTAWNDVRNLILEMSRNHPENTFYYTYSEEQMGYYDGKATIKNGEFLEEIQYTDSSKEAFENSFFMWGGEDDFRFNEKTGTYEYIESEDYDDAEM